MEMTGRFHIIKRFSRSPDSGIMKNGMKIDRIYTLLKIFFSCELVPSQFPGGGYGAV